MIWIGLLIGLALGGAVGVIIMALIRTSGDVVKLRQHKTNSYKTE